MVHLAAAATTASLLLASSVNAFWRQPCAKPVVDALIDPIVNPGGPSGHAHTIMGASNIGYNSNFDTMRQSNCTTCAVKDDLSAYWIPQLYYQYSNGSFHNVDHGGMIVYFLQRGASNETIQAFPDGFRMLTGDPTVRNNTGSDASQAISWLCLNYDLPATAQTPNLANTVCPDGLRAQVFFPGCWDGKNLDSPDHKSHVAYPSGIDNGGCPASHPVHLVSIFYEVWYSVDPFNKLNDGGKFVLSTGDPTGYSLHGDFLNGWDHDVLQRAVDTCTNDSGVITDCPVFENEGRLLTSDQNNQCNIAEEPVPNVPIDGVLEYLPNCVEVQNGPGPADLSRKAPGCVNPPGLGSGSPAPQSTSSARISSAQPTTVASTSTAQVVTNSVGKATGTTVPVGKPSTTTSPVQPATTTSTKLFISEPALPVVTPTQGVCHSTVIHTSTVHVTKTSVVYKTSTINVLPTGGAAAASVSQPKPSVTPTITTSVAKPTWYSTLSISTKPTSTSVKPSTSKTSSAVCTPTVAARDVVEEREDSKRAKPFSHKRSYHRKPARFD